MRSSLHQFTLALALYLLSASIAHATVFSQLQGVVHDPQHRPLAAAQIKLTAAHSAFTLAAESNSEGAFTLSNIPLGDYTVTVAHTGFATLQQTLTMHSETTPILHLQLQIASVSQTINVTALAASIDTVTPTTLVDRIDIAETPGADRTNSMAMITDYTPGAYMTHDMLHMRGGHQVAWLIDGVEIPNTNIASNLAAQIDPKDIDYLEVQRGSYTASLGDRTYGIFNVVPRTGFERDREAELLLSAGNFLQTNDQLSFGDHNQRSAYYISLNGNRSDYGLAPPIGAVHHDATNGEGGFLSLLYNRTPKDQLRLIAQLREDFFQIPYDPSSTDFEAAQFDSHQLRDTQHERDGAAAFTWLHTINPQSVVQLSPFFHSNTANYDSVPTDTPTATTVDRTSNYAGAQASITTTIARNTLQAGLYSFGQHDSYLFNVLFNDGTGSAPIHENDATAGGVVEEYVSDNYKPTDWLSLDAGLRLAHFQSSFTENEVDPRFGVALRVPRLNWVFRGFYGRFYQPPPLITASGSVVNFANANSTTLVALHGERDEEHQFGVQIPYRGWLLDADTFKTRVNNFLDHSNIGDSSLYFPITVDGALIRAWELTLRSPRIAHFGQAHLAYSNQIAQQRGNITGGLICTPIGDPACDAGFNYTPVDHDQRDTLNVGFNATLPGHAYASANYYFGSGFHNGDPDPTTPYPNEYLPYNTTFDLALGKAITESLSASITATNLANRRVLLDNSLTFGGFHFNDPRQLTAELRYRFHY